MSSAMKATLVAVFIVGGLFVLRMSMAPIIRQWATINQVLTLPQRLLAFIVDGSLWLSALTVIIALFVVVRSRSANHP